MYEKFTDRAKRVLALANQTAQGWNHEYIGTEHILMGLIKEGSGIGCNVLKQFNINLDHARKKIEEIVQTGPDIVSMGKLPMTPRGEKIIRLAIDCAKKMNCNYVGTEHLMHGLLEEKDGVASHVLMDLSLTLEKYEKNLEFTLGPNTRENGCKNCVSYEVCVIVKHINKTPLLVISSNLNDVRKEMEKVVASSCKCYKEKE
jgi:ATP-dependent Clp protease ATP-binding subunit ClpC